MPEEARGSSYTTRLLTKQTWPDFAALVEANNGVWGGCWCMGFHPQGLDRDSAEHNRTNKQALTASEQVHQLLVYDDDGTCVGWCQFGTPVELPNIQNRKVYAAKAGAPPDWRIGCVFTGKGHRRRGVLRAALTAALAEIRDRGGGVVEAYPEQVEGRKPQSGAYFHTGPEDVFADVGFERDRQIAKWRWVMRQVVS